MVKQPYPITALSNIYPRVILVIGDLILDRYTYGIAKRISPEAPVPIFLVHSRKSQAGGAGNVALNLQALGMKPRIVSSIGNDQEGETLHEIFKEANIDCRFLYRENGMKTIVKTRIIADSQQLLRIDDEIFSPLSQSIEQNIEENIDVIFDNVAVVAISDYAKGFLTHSLLQRVIQEAKKRNIPCITDPKGTDFKKYSGTTILKPNAYEAMSVFGGGFQDLDEAAQSIFKEVDVETVMITRSEKGISLYSKNGEHTLYPVIPKDVRDVTGAGDTVLAVLAMAISASFPLHEAIFLANIAASCAIEQIGCAAIRIEDIIIRLLKERFTDKLCDIDTVRAIITLLGACSITLITLQVLSYREIIKLHEFFIPQHEKKITVVYIDELEPDKDLLKFLSSLDRVDMILYKQEGIDSFTDSSIFMNLPTISL